ncbi:MAG: hypothetical protein ACI9FR_000086 [Cryomorphaceae bacterium]|jgi:hypothetical protein
MNKLTSLATLALLSLSLNSHADSPSFTYVELEYVAAGSFEISDDSLSVDVDIDGYALNASVELGIFFLQASRFELESDVVLDASLKDSISSIALGMTFALPQSQVYGLIRARHDDLSLRGGGFDEDTDGGVVGAEVGVRINLTDRFELNANAGVPSTEDGKSFGVGAQFFITKNIGITLDFSSLELEEDGITANFDTTSVGLRFTF